MKQKHTPGPWRTDAYFRVLAKNRVEPTREHPVFVVAQCSTYCGQGIGIPKPSEKRANTLLIAAAPDLLEAATEALEALERIGLMAHSDAAHMLRAAIAKAEGRSE